MENLFTEKDMAQIASHGLTTDAVREQMDNFERGFAKLDIDRAATAGDGIMVLDRQSAEHFSKEYGVLPPGARVVKFVPASGAATRMFKELFEFADTGKKSASVEKLLAGVTELAFYDAIRHRIAGMDDRAVARAILDYGAQLPKALIAFHRYGDEVRTALEEHLVEGAQYTAVEGCVSIHFTVSVEHEAGFRELLGFVIPKYEKRFGVKYDISFSFQSPQTDTIAVDSDNLPFREKDGSLLFRPAGHGALLRNLNDVDADLIFIKNIDNVTTDRLRGDTVLYKKVLGGMALSLQKRIFDCLSALDRGADDTQLNDMAGFVGGELSFGLPVAFGGLDRQEKAAYLRRVLDRPLRVCAMVRNEGEPGGGPFWVNGSDGSKSLQIGEPSQVPSDRKYLLSEGTHFNPVDVVCAVGNYRGGKFNLMKYSDPGTGFISEKSKDGRVLKAMELPGLWNGAMANWNTVFVEVPVSTFTPVKEVADLLRPQHQA